MVTGRRFTRILVYMGLSSAIWSCATWRPYNAGLGGGQALPYRLRATLSDRSRLALTDPFVQADTLYGRVRGDTVGVPVAEIFELERQRVSPERTAAVLIGMPAVALGVTYLIVCGSNDCSPQF